MQIHCKNLTRLPSSNRLFQDFATDFDKVASWYSPPPRSFDQWQLRAKQVSVLPGFSRKRLIETLRNFNSELGAGEATEQNLSRLAQSDAVAVVSGQQVGLFGGPAYSVYKAASAVQLATELREKGLNAVPVFWLATNDSDFEEIRTAHFLDSRNTQISLRLSDSRKDPNQVTGSILLDGVESLLQELSEGFGDLHFQKEALSELAGAYRPVTTLGGAYARWFTRLFAEYGLIVLDPLLPGFRSGLNDFYSVCVERRDEMVNALIERGRALQAAGYQPQIWVEESESLLFLVDQQRRTKLSYENGRYLAKGHAKPRWSPDDLLEMTTSQAERLSPGVLLRPLLQDHLLPTLAYIGGPAEVAYFAQIQAIAGAWQRELLILPRPSLTIVDRKSQRLLRKYDLSVEEVLSSSAEDLAQRIVRTTRGAELLAEFDALKVDLEQGLRAIEESLHLIDPSLTGMLSGVRDKMLYQLGKLSNRFVENQKQCQPVLENHLKHLRNRLTPGGKPQERVLGFSQFMAEEGPAILTQLLPALTPTACHKICYL